MDYVDRLTALRQDRDIGQKEIAAVLGCQQSAISKYEKRRAKYSIEDIIALCRFYQVSADYVLGLPEHLPYPESLKDSPIRITRLMYPFKRPAGGVSLTTRPQIRKRTKFSGREVSNLLKTDSDKGIQNLGFGGFSVHFWASKSEPRAWGRVAPTRPEPRSSGARSPRKTLGGTE